MTRAISRVAMSGFIFCLIHFSISIAIIILSRTSVIMTGVGRTYAHDFYVWRRSATGQAMAVMQYITFVIIWIHVIIFLRKFKEFVFIDLVLIIHILWSLYLSFFYLKYIPLAVGLLLTAIDALLLGIGLWLIKSAYLKGFMRWYTIAIVAEFLSSYFVLPWLYDNFGLRWLMVSPFVFSLALYSILTVMFLSIWVRSRSYSPPSEE